MDNIGSYPSSNNNPVTVIGRVKKPSGKVIDIVFQGTSDIQTNDLFEIQYLIQKPSDLAKDFLNRAEFPVAFVAIGFGPAPISDFDRLLWKGDFDEAKHPRVPEGSPEGGEFRSTDGAADAEPTDQPTDGLINQNVVVKDLISRVEKRAARRLLRNRLIAGLRLLTGIAADAVPVAGEIFDAYEIAQTVSDGISLEEDLAAAEGFVQAGPQTLESLQMSTDYQPFSSFDAFKKDLLGKVFGPAGDGYEYHHIVEQGGKGLGNLPAGLMDSTENLVRIPRLLHEEISAEYGKTYEDTGKSLRDWLSSQPYEVRRAEGIKVMRKLGIIK